MSFTQFGSTLRPGNVLLGKYRVERILGRGGMGIVVAARHLELSELFAIKLLALDADSSPEGAARFLREARIAARLTSEHVARVYDVGRLEDGTSYLVMEYLDGDTLARELERRERFPLAEAASLVLQACDAIAEAHALGIVHRDIKLANLFSIRRRGGRRCLKVIDFGISKQRGQGDPLTEPGLVLGSPHSMSPEQFLNAQAIDGRTDVWALGVVLYQLTTGEAPFRGASLPQLMHSILRGTPPRPSELRPELPAQLDEVTRRCLCKHPEDRFPNIESLAEEVRALSRVTTLPRASSGVPAPRSATSETQRTRVVICCRDDDPADLQLASEFYDALRNAEGSPLLPARTSEPERRVVELSEALLSCDALLLLLSSGAAASELILAALGTARSLAARNAGRPYILVVRVGSAGQELDPLTEPDGPDEPSDLRYCDWRGELDTDDIVQRLLAREGGEAGTPPPAPVPQPSAVGAADGEHPERVPTRSTEGVPLELPGGAVSSRSRFHVTRPAIEAACQHELEQPGALLRVKGPRQMGKTSLLMGLVDHVARDGACRTVAINLQLIDARRLVSLDGLLHWMCAVITRRLRLPLQALETQWDDVFGAKDNCTSYIEERILSSGAPLVLALDNVDRVYESPATAEEFLGLLRAWHEMGKSHPLWSSLRLVLAYSTEVYLPLDINHSPFNVGLAATLRGWDAETVASLADKHGLRWRGHEVDQLMRLTGGHPHLVRLALYHLASGANLASVIETSATDDGLFADHLKCLLWHLQHQPALAGAVAQVMASDAPVRLGTDVAFKLVSLGLVQLQGNQVRPARELYRQYFSERLHIPSTQTGAPHVDSGGLAR